MRYLGLSECSAATLRKACKVAKIDALQIGACAVEFVRVESTHSTCPLEDVGVHLHIRALIFVQSL